MGRINSELLCGWISTCCWLPARAESLTPASNLSLVTLDHGNCIAQGGRPRNRGQRSTRLTIDLLPKV